MIQTKTYNFKGKSADQRAEKLYRDGQVYSADREGYCLVSNKVYKAGMLVYKLSAGSMYGGLKAYVEELAKFNRRQARIKRGAMNEFTTPINGRLLDPAPKAEETPKYVSTNWEADVDDLKPNLAINVSNDGILTELQNIKSQFAKLNENCSAALELMKRVLTTQEVSPVVKFKSPGRNRGKESEKATANRIERAEQKKEMSPRMTDKFLNSLSLIERSVLEILDQYSNNRRILTGTPTEVLDTLRFKFPQRKFPVNARQFTKTLNRLDLKKAGIKMTAKGGSPRFLSLELVK